MKESHESPGSLDHILRFSHCQLLKVCALGPEVNRDKERCGYVTTDTTPTMEKIHSSTFQCHFPGVGIL